jgi:phosphohistidine phosphatase SixA
MAGIRPDKLANEALRDWVRIGSLKEIFMKPRTWVRIPSLTLLASALGMFLAGGMGFAQSLSGEALVKALQQGGYIIAMRHASSPREAPGKETANPDNVKPERQLDAEGRASAAAMGKALHDLKIPIGDVFTSPTYRALETIRYAQFGTPQTVPELGENGQSMQGGTAAQAAWLQKKVTQFPKGANTVILTHLPNLTGAFPQLAAGLADGEALIFGPDGKGGATLVARVKIEEWSRMRP